jgi:hypothetical protein
VHVPATGVRRGTAEHSTTLQSTCGGCPAASCEMNAGGVACAALAPMPPLLPGRSLPPPPLLLLCWACCCCEGAAPRGAAAVECRSGSEASAAGRAGRFAPRPPPAAGAAAARAAEAAAGAAAGFFLTPSAAPKEKLLLLPPLALPTAALCPLPPAAPLLAASPAFPVMVRPDLLAIALSTASIHAAAYGPLGWPGLRPGSAAVSGWLVMPRRRACLSARDAVRSGVTGGAACSQHASRAASLPM